MKNAAVCAYRAHHHEVVLEDEAMAKIVCARFSCLYKKARDWAMTNLTSFRLLARL